MTWYACLPLKDDEEEDEDEEAIFTPNAALPDPGVPKGGGRGGGWAKNP
jgi:hypothetical protein